MNVTRSFGVLILLTIMSLGAEGWMRVIPKRGDPLYPGDAELAEYLSYLRDGYDQDPAEYEMRPKRGRYGNKYADNKSYGFWISALNKADNYKRGKRAGKLSVQFPYFEAQIISYRFSSLCTSNESYGAGA